jgi:hypothetical protein
MLQLGANFSQGAMDRGRKNRGLLGHCKSMLRSLWRGQWPPAFMASRRQQLWRASTQRARREDEAAGLIRRVGWPRRQDLTRNLLVRSQPLYPLSYVEMRSFSEVARSPPGELLVFDRLAFEPLGLLALAGLVSATRHILEGLGRVTKDLAW